MNDHNAPTEEASQQSCATEMRYEDEMANQRYGLSLAVQGALAAAWWVALKDNPKIAVAIAGFGWFFAWCLAMAIRAASDAWRAWFRLASRICLPAAPHHWLLNLTGLSFIAELWLLRVSPRPESNAAPPRSWYGLKPNEAGRTVNHGALPQRVIPFSFVTAWCVLTVLTVGHCIEGDWFNVGDQEDKQQTSSQD